MARCLFLWRRKLCGSEDSCDIFCAIHILFCRQFQRSQKIATLPLLRCFIQQDHLLCQSRSTFVAEFTDILSRDWRKTTEPIAIDHHSPTRFALKDGLKVGRVNDSLIVPTRPLVACHWFVIGKQLNAVLVQTERECPTYQVGGNGVAIAFQSNQSLPADDHAIKKAIIACARGDGSKLALFLRKPGCRKLSCCVVLTLRIHFL